MKLRPKIKIIVLALFVTTSVLGLFMYSIGKAHEKGYKLAIKELSPILEKEVRTAQEKGKLVGALLMQRSIYQSTIKSCKKNNRIYFTLRTQKGPKQFKYGCYELKEL